MRDINGKILGGIPGTVVGENTEQMSRIVDDSSWGNCVEHFSNGILGKMPNGTREGIAKRDWGYSERICRRNTWKNSLSNISEFRYFRRKTMRNPK